MELIDKQLSASYGYSLTNSWDFNIITDEKSILQSAQSRILSELGTWLFDDNYWWLMTELKNTPVQLITEEQIKWYVTLALQPMIDDSRVVSIKSVNITNREIDSIQVEIKLELNLVVWLLNINSF